MSSQFGTSNITQLLREVAGWVEEYEGGLTFASIRGEGDLSGPT